MIFVLLVLAQDAFEPGARAQVRPAAALTIDSLQHARYARLARSGHERHFTRDPGPWIPYVLDGLLSDDERIAAASGRTLRMICLKQKVTDEEGRNPVVLDRLPGAAYRAGLYDRCLAWYLQNKNEIAAAPAGRGPRLHWNGILADLKSGGGWDDPSCPPGRAFASLKALGMAGLAPLTGFIDDDDLRTARAAACALNKLSGRDTPLPTDSTRGALQAEWRAWFKQQGFHVDPDAHDLTDLLSDSTTAAEVDARLERLNRGDVEARLNAARELRNSRFRHEARLQQALETADAPEVRIALTALLDEIPDLKRQALELRDDAAWLRRSVDRLRSRHADAAAFGTAVERLLTSLQELWTEWRDLDHRRRVIGQACGLDLPGRARWADARAAWEAFELEVDPPGELRDRLAAELLELDEAALKDVEDVRREALTRIAAGRRTEVQGFLDAQRFRFETTAAEDRLTVLRDVLGP